MLSIFWKEFIECVYPETCGGCNDLLLHSENMICISCLTQLPKTGYHYHIDNELRNRLMARIPLQFALPFLHFTPKGITQHLLHNLKYANRPELGTMLGYWFGTDLKNAGYNACFDVIIPVPLHASKLRSRGYNQSERFAHGLSESLGIPMSAVALTKTNKAGTQTVKGRLDRWLNVSGSIHLTDLKALEGKNVLLADDVVTTGATLEACGQALLSGGIATLSLAAIAVA